MKARKAKKDLAVLLKYLWHDEARHYEESPDKKHIFLVMKRLAHYFGCKEFKLS